MELVRINITEALSANGCTKQLIDEATAEAEVLRSAGFNEETVRSLCEAYAGDGDLIEGEYTLEKMMQSINPDLAWKEFWEEVNA